MSDEDDGMCAYVCATAVPSTVNCSSRGAGRGHSRLHSVVMEQDWYLSQVLAPGLRGGRGEGVGEVLVLFRC